MARSRNMNVTSFSERKSGNDIITIILLIGLHRISRHLIILLDGSQTDLQIVAT